MSMDIRSWLVSKKPPKAKEEDDDVIPESPDVQIENKKKESRKRRIVQDDSDEEIFSSKKKTPNTEKKKSLSSKSKHKSPSKNNLKEVKAADLFGGPIKRTEPLVTKAKKNNTEIGIHSDDEFDQSLLELDVIDLEKDDLGSNDINHGKAIEKEEATNHKLPSNINSINNDKEVKLQKTVQSKDIDITKAKKYDNKDKDIKIKKEKNNDETIKKIDYSELIQENIASTSDNHEQGLKKKKDVAINNSDHKKIKAEKTKSDAEIKPNNISESKQKKENKPYKSNSSVNGVEDHKNIIKEEIRDETDRKRNFSVFIGDDNVMNDSQGVEPKNKKRKLNRSLNESVLTDEERHERRMQSAALYKNYLNRSGPKYLGSKEIPEGSPNCLKDCAFLLTGVLDSFERNDIVAAVTKYGGCVKNSISKKVTHVLAGEEAGPAKLAKAQELGIKIINEDEFLKLIKNSPDKTSNHNLDIKKESKGSKKSKESRNSTKEVQSNDRGVFKDEHSSKATNKTTNSDMRERIQRKSNRKDKESDEKVSPRDIEKIVSKSKSKHDVKPIKNETIKIQDEVKGKDTSPVKSDASSSLMWVDKYKPQNLKQIIGQHGEASNVKKLTNWLTKWYANRKAKLPKPSPWAKNDDGGYFKAALLSGPPGVGKTTTVSLVCKELGFDTVELNASDSRSKTLVKQQVGELLTTTSLSAYAKGATGKQAVTKKHVLVMDEVDGMAGNEDRGGLQELIALIKSTSVPIVCMCNDRNSPKMRSLVNYCYDLRFSRPRVDQIKSAMLSICYKEGVKITPDALGKLIAAAGQDVRQTLHALSVWAADAGAGHDASQGRVDVRMGPWEAIRKVFSAEDHKTMSLNDRSDLFFTDYSLAPLFVQENYLSVVPHCYKNEILERFAQAADNISAGDLVDARIRSGQAWSLLPIQAMLSSVVPGQLLAGHVGAQIQFPGWLGKNSRANKIHRLCQEIHAHTRLSTSGSKSSIFLDYAPHLRDAIVNPLIKDRSEGVAKSLEVLEAYHLLREDLESLTELSLWPGQRNPNVLIDAKVKAAMTRTYNKQASALPYAPGAVRKGRARDADDAEDDADDEGDEQADDDPDNDALIKKKKSKDSNKAGSSEDKAGTSKEKAGSRKEKAGASKDKKRKK